MDERYDGPRTPGRIFLAAAHLLFAFGSIAGLMVLAVQLPNQSESPDDVLTYVLGMAFFGFATAASLTLGIAMLRLTPGARSLDASEASWSPFRRRWSLWERRSSRCSL